MSDDGLGKFIDGVNIAVRSALANGVSRNAIGNAFLGMALRNLRPDMDRVELEAIIGKIAVLITPS